jgi:hypothetical protein
MNNMTRVISMAEFRANLPKIVDDIYKHNHTYILYRYNEPLVILKAYYAGTLFDETLIKSHRAIQRQRR